VTSPQFNTSREDALVLRSPTRWRAYAARFSSREPAVIGSLLILATVSGAVAKFADESGVGWASDLGDFPAVWVLALALIGWAAPTPGRAALRAAIFFVTMCLAYYAWASFVMGFPVASDIWLWTGLAATAVPLLAAVVRCTGDRHGLLPGVILATVAALAIVDGVVWQFWWAWRGDATPDWFPMRPFQALTNVAVALLVAGVLPRDHRTRAWAIILLIPVTILISRMLPNVMDVLLRLIRLF
jgi:hypothetical protein